MKRTTVPSLAAILTSALLLAVATVDGANYVWTKYSSTTPGNSDGSSSNGRIPLGTKGDNTHVVRACILKDGAT